jgi:hypothetical protein
MIPVQHHGDLTEIRCAVEIGGLRGNEMSKAIVEAAQGEFKAAVPCLERVHVGPLQQGIG